MSISSTKTRFC